MLNIVIPMAGAGNRFAKAGYKDPKPLIPIHGIPMIKLIIENLRPSQPHRFIFICQRTHVEEYGLEAKLKSWAPDSALIQIEGLTEGAACTVLAARELLNTSNPLMIANSDQYVNLPIDDYLDEMPNTNLDGLIMTMTAVDPKWSFVGLSPEKLIITVVEKQVISDEATVGIYNFRHGSDFVRAAESMIKKELRVKGEFYVAPAYNELIAEGQKIGIHNIGREGSGMYGLGTPVDLDLFLKLPLSKEVTNIAA